MKTTTTTQTPWLLTVQDVAEISRQTIEGVRWAIRAGKLAAVRPPGTRQYLITRAAVAAWLGLPIDDVRSRCSEPSPGDDTDHAA